MAVRRILAAALTAPLLTLAACGGGGSIADPPISSAPSSSPPTQHRETPEHFIRRWAAEDTRIEKTGDMAHFRQNVSRLPWLHETGEFGGADLQRRWVYSHKGMDRHQDN